MDQPSVNSHDPSWVEEDVREREAIAAWDHDEQWPSVQKPPFHIDKAKEFDSRLTVLGEPGQLGRGGFGRVDKVIYGSVSLARKCIERKGRLRNFTMEDLQQEALTMRRLNHRHVVKLVGAYMPKPWQFCLLIWPAAVCDLHTLLDNLDWVRESQDDRDDISLRLNALELNDLSAIKPGLNRTMDSAAKCPLDFLRGLLGCTARAMAYCHLNGIRHLDIKTTNILLKANRVYLADFGISKDVSGQEQTAMEGEPGTEKWRAPEYYSKSSSMQLSDIYSLGLVYLNIAAVLYNIRLAEFDDALVYPDHLNRSDKLAVREEKLRSFLQKVASSTSETPQEIKRSQRLVDLIANMISPTPNTRLPANKINERLSILGGTHQIYYNECCKRPISWTEDADEKLAILSSLRAENEDLKKKIAELYNEEKMYREQFENIQKTYEEDITNQKVLFESREKKLESDLHASNAAKSAIQKELDEAKLSISKLAEENAACIKQHDIEFGTAKRAISMAEGERSAMQRKIDELTSQNLELAKAIAAQRVMAQESESSSGISDEDLEAAAIDITPEHSPPQSPIKGTTRHSMLETETLKTSLQHAQRTIQSQRSQLHREKMEKLEFRRIIQDLRDDLEKTRNDLEQGTAPSRIRGGRKVEPKRVRARPATGLNSLFTHVFQEVDDGSPRNSTKTYNDSDFETANEPESENDFVERHENSFSDSSTKS